VSEQEMRLKVVGNRDELGSAIAQIHQIVKNGETPDEVKTAAIKLIVSDHVKQFPETERR
jgi:hypothetical protein